MSHLSLSEPPRIAPPIVPTQRAPAAFRDGKLVMVEPGAMLPDCCVKCGAPAEGFRKRFNLSWHHPALYLTILAGLLIYIIVALLVRKTARIDIPICARHRARRRNTLLLGLGVFLVGVALFVVAIALEKGAPAIAGIVFVLGGIVTMIIGAQTVTPSKIDDRAAWIKGAGAEFLVLLPELGTPRR